MTLHGMDIEQGRNLAKELARQVSDSRCSAAN